MSDPFDLVVVGLGSAGSAAAEFAAGLELRVAAVERGRPGGHRLWSGDVPISALAATARAAHIMRTADRLGLQRVDPRVDPEVVWRRIRAVQADVAAVDASMARWREIGIEVVQGTAQWAGPGTVVVDGRELEARYVLWCTGSEPVVADVDGLGDVPADTLDEWFRRERPATSTVVLGSGIEAVAIAQALVRLGLDATLVTADAHVLVGEEPSLAAAVQSRLVAEGVKVVCGVAAHRVEHDAGAAPDAQVRLRLADGELVTGGALLIAGDRRPTTDGLDPQLGEPALEVDARGRTPARTTYAAGSVAGRHHRAHSAAHEGIRAVRDMFLPGRTPADTFAPRSTFTDPELAGAGMTSTEAEAVHGDATDVWTLDLGRLGRARADSTEEATLVVVTVHERIVGAHLLAPRAGEAIHELALAIRHGMKLHDIAALTHVESTIAAGIGRLAVESGIERVQRYRWLLRRS